MRWKRYLFAGLCIQQDPTKLNDLGGVLGNIHAVFITRRSNVYHDITVEVRGLGRGGWLRCHDHSTLRGPAAQLSSRSVAWGVAALSCELTSGKGGRKERLFGSGCEGKARRRQRAGEWRAPDEGSFKLRGGEVGGGVSGNRDKTR